MRKGTRRICADAKAVIPQDYGYNWRAEKESSGD